MDGTKRFLVLLFLFAAPIRTETSPNQPAYFIGNLTEESRTLTLHPPTASRPQACHSGFIPLQNVVGQSSGNRQAVIGQSLGSCQTVVGQSSGSRRAVVGQSSGSHEIVFTQTLRLKAFLFLASLSR